MLSSVLLFYEKGKTEDGEERGDLSGESGNYLETIYFPLSTNNDPKTSTTDLDLPRSQHRIQS